MSGHLQGVLGIKLQLSERGNQRGDLRAGVIEAGAGVDDMMRAVTLVGVVELQAEDMREFLRRHARSGEHAGALNRLRRGDDDDQVNRFVPALFEQ